MEFKEIFQKTWTDFYKDKHGFVSAFRTFKNKFNCYRKIKLVKKITTSKYGLEDDNIRKMIEAYFQIKSIQRQRVYNWLIVVLTILLIYVTWIKK